ncbi:electron transport complex subunit RsxA [Candidatus Margulisiibacteriota bacterium]
MAKNIVIFISAALVNNFVLAYFLGICPFLGVSKKTKSAVSMGLAVIFVMVITAIISSLIDTYFLKPFNLSYLMNVSFILVIASLVQVVEMFLRKTSKPLYEALGIYLPLITTNCAILGLALFGVLREYTLVQNIFFGLGAGVGFTLALVIMSGIREELEFADVPKPFKGVPIALITAGCLSLAFMGFAGLI